MLYIVCYLVHTHTIIKKFVYYRQLHKINKDTLHADLEAISFDLNETDVNKVVEKYNKELLCILNKHAPEKCKKFADMRE